MVRLTIPDERSRAVTIDVPDECPRCRRGIQVSAYASAVVHTETGRAPDTLEVVFRCPRQECRRIYLAQFGATGRVPDQHIPEYWRFLRFIPMNAAREFTEEIVRLSPGFVAIYNQALQAELAGLNLLCGAGFRKALEFLVKDYLKTISENAEKHSAIENSQLGACIANFVNDPNIKSTARRAAWLGNDEAHYIRKWQDKELSDLKKLIDLSLYWVSSEILTRELEQSMPDPKTKG